VSDIQTLTASGSPPPKIDTDALERSLGGLVDTLMKRWHWAHGTGTATSVLDDLAQDMGSIAQTMTSLMTANDIAWAILTITFGCDVDQQPWLVRRRRRVLENLFDVAKDGKQKMN
jgi:hypothetical protein